MSNINKTINLMPEPDKSIGRVLIDFYETMKRLESDPNRGGKQATAITMAISDLENIMAATAADIKT